MPFIVSVTVMLIECASQCISSVGNIMLLTWD